MRMRNNALKCETEVFALYDDTTFGATYKAWSKDYPVGWNTPYPNAYPKHKGVDSGNYRGQPVYALFTGTARKVQKSTVDARGKCVEIDTYGNWVRYMHLDTITINEGDWVEAGQQIGTVGNTSTDKIGVHLHVDVWLLSKNNYVDPYPYLTGERNLYTGGNENNTDNNGGGVGNYTTVAENGVFHNTSGSPIKARTEPSRKAKEKGRAEWLENGEYVAYDKYSINDGHIWVRSKKSGNWFAWRVQGGEKFGWIE